MPQSWRQRQAYENLACARCMPCPSPHVSTRRNHSPPSDRFPHEQSALAWTGLSPGLRARVGSESLQRVVALTRICSLPASYPLSCSTCTQSVLRTFQNNRNLAFAPFNASLPTAASAQSGGRDGGRGAEGERRMDRWREAVQKRQSEFACLNVIASRVLQRIFR
jgi:hypothetical protein